MVRTEYLDVGHIVQFYSNEEELVGQVVDYLLGALRGEGAAVVIATAAHRHMFEARLARAGVDLAEAERNSTYLALDARDTLDALMTGGQLDAAGFEHVIGGLIRGAGQAGARIRPVRAYGEMVALLWEAGLVDVAVEVEEMWNGLGLQCSFSLFCAYPADSVTDGHPHAFAEVSRLHQAVVGPGNLGQDGSGVTRAFAFSRDAPAAARHFAVDAVRQLGAPELVDDTALVVTELAANAIVHAQSGFTLDLAARPGMLRISVHDAGPMPAGTAGPGLAAAPLHGLGAVDALARRWGVRPSGHGGKTVWVELRRPRRPG